MDEFVKYVTNKLPTVFLIIIGAIIPGILALFVYKQDLLVNYDFIKILIISIALSSPSLFIIIGYIIIDILNLDKEKYIYIMLS